MKINEIIGKAKSEKRAALTEAESKVILAKYGIPVVNERVALTAVDAAEIATELGYPVVLKGLGSKLTHKTERGLVALNLKCQTEVLEKAKFIGLAAGEDLEGYLVQPMVQGRREFVAGMFCDPDFGPVVMFGLGGVFTEALEDVVFRVAPISEAQADALLDEVRSSKLLGAFRGEPPANRRKIIEIILGLSRLAMEYPDIVEVDINPLVIDAKGEIVAVDALIILGMRNERTSMPQPANPQDIINMFSPRSVAFIGASNHVEKWGYRLLAHTVAGEFPGEIYLINPRLDEIAGRKVYKSVLDVPAKIDLAIVTIPATEVLGLIPQLKEKKIKYMVLITAGFAEVGGEGIQLERDLVRAASDAGILFIGPNMMGISNPHTKLFSSWTSSRPKPGSIGLVSQSGNLGTQFMLAAEKANIGLRLFCGTGNEAMVSIDDFLSAFEMDDITETVVLYVEGVKNGRRFLQLAERVSRNKPVILLKGGRTEAGNSAASSHTGALASNIRVFNAACKQAGVILARHPTDLLDYSTAFSSLPLPMGNRVGLLTVGGGWGVVATDGCAESGLAIPQLSADIISRIDKVLPSYWSHGNPIDTVATLDLSILTKLVEILAQWDECDAVIHLGVVGMSVFAESFRNASIKMNPKAQETLLPKKEAIEAILDMEIEFIKHTVRLMEEYKKPILGSGNLDGHNGKAVLDVNESKFKGVTFPTPGQAVNALAGMVQYGKWLKREQIETK